MKNISRPPGRQSSEPAENSNGLHNSNILQEGAIKPPILRSSMYFTGSASEIKQGVSVDPRLRVTSSVSLPPNLNSISSVTVANNIKTGLRSSTGSNLNSSVTPTASAPSNLSAIPSTGRFGPITQPNYPNSNFVPPVGPSNSFASSGSSVYPSMGPPPPGPTGSMTSGLRSSLSSSNFGPPTPLTASGNVNGFNRPNAGSAPSRGSTGSTPLVSPSDLPRPIRQPSSSSILFNTFSPSGRRVPPSVSSSFQAVDTGNASPRHVRSTFVAPPSSAKLLREVELPFGLIVQPFASTEYGEQEIPLVDLSVPVKMDEGSGNNSNFSVSGLIGGFFKNSSNKEDGKTLAMVQMKSLPPRCVRCSAYMNCYVKWESDGNMWNCNMCKQENITPNWYYCGIDGNKQRLDKANRLELSRGSIDYVVSSEEYSSRKMTDHPTYVFAIDISQQAVVSGFTNASILAIKSNLKLISGGYVGLCVFSNSVQLFCKTSSKAVTDGFVGFKLCECEIVDPYPGAPYHSWILSLEENFEIIDGLLNSLSDINMISKLQPDSNICLKYHAGSCGYSISPSCVVKICVETITASSISNAKIYCFTSSGTNHFPGSYGFIKCREHMAMYGKLDELITYASLEEAVKLTTDKEILEQMQVYISLKAECLKNNISVDIFLHSGQGDYRDVPAYSELSVPTGGSMYLFDGDMRSECDIKRLNDQVRVAIEKLCGNDVSVKLRSSIGYQLAGYYGVGRLDNVAEELYLPSISKDNTMCFILKNDTILNDEEPVYIQIATLYTTYVITEGGKYVAQRRVRIHNMSYFSTSNPVALYRHVDLECLIAVMCKHAAELASKRVTWLDSGSTGVLGLGSNLDSLSSLEFIKHVLFSCLRKYRKLCCDSPRAGKLTLPDSLRCFPLYCLGLMKYPAFISNLMSKNVRINVRGHERSYHLGFALSASVWEIMKAVYPRVYALHMLEDDDGDIISVKYVRSNSPAKSGGLYPSSTFSSMNSFSSTSSLSPKGSDGVEGEILTKMPERVLSPNSEVFESDGLYVVDDGRTLWLYVGRNISQIQMEKWFSNINPHGIDKRPTQLIFNESNSVACRMNNICKELVSQHVCLPDMKVIYMDECPSYIMHKFNLRLVEDSIYGELSYADFLCNLHTKITSDK